MDARHYRNLPIRSLILVWAVYGFFGMTGATAMAHGNHNAELTLGAADCESCHSEEFNAWRKTKHAKSFNILPASDKGNEIAEKMGMEMDRGESLCIECHFTVTAKSPKVAVEGITCESCHGPAKKWLDPHSAKGIKREQESKSARSARMEKSAKLGLLRPQSIYQVAENCFQCHTVPNEELVIKGGHTAGSKFELVSWTQGEVRHNVFEKKENKGASAARKRVLYITGKALDLEYGMRGVATATKKAKYAISMIKRVVRARSALKKIKKAVQNEKVAGLIGDMLSAADNKYMKWNNEKALTAQAGKVADAAKAFVAMQADSKSAANLASIDSLIPGADKFKGKVFNP